MKKNDCYILIADSGASKTDWCLVQCGNIVGRFIGRGISPVFQSEEEITLEIKQNIAPLLKDTSIEAIHFYGAGCIPEKTGLVRNAIHNSFPIDSIHVYSDLVAAAHSLCGKEPGIACILGTGSNSCQWDGSSIVKQISPLGFILGDEGSGAALGKRLVGDALKNQLTKGLKEDFLSEYGLTPSEIIDRVYKQPFPSRFLASLTPFLLKHVDDPSIKKIITDTFSDFFERNVLQYDYQKNNVHFVGSIAWHFAETLKEVAINQQIKMGSIVQSPIAGLIGYHTEDVI